MFSFEKQHDEQQEQAFRLCSDLLSVATELGINTGFVGMLSMDMEAEQLKSIELLIADAIEAAYEAKKEDLRRMRRCPMGYLWQPEGTGWRCEGGTHYCSAEEIKQFMD